MKLQDKRGLKVMARVVKNKSAPPFGEFSFVIDYKRGPRNEVTAFYLGRDAKVIKPKSGQAGLFVVCGRTMKRTQFYENMRQDAAFREKVWAAISEKIDPYAKSKLD